jgi:DNA-binding NarL/FixJ family response regulator
MMRATSQKNRAMATRVYVIEDHPVMRATLIEFLSLRGDLEMCGEAANAEEALQDLGKVNASLILLDLSLPGRSGLDLLPDIQKLWQLPCIILSGHREQGYVDRALAAGARGYILKGRPNEIPEAIRTVMGGGTYISESLRLH